MAEPPSGKLGYGYSTVRQEVRYPLRSAAEEGEFLPPPHSARPIRSPFDMATMQQANKQEFQQSANLKGHAPVVMVS
ncbi:hypothetical protein CAI21_16945 [Alkalilimnicola ehrlichii]|uniref:Uncharacterized protein n=1 Tax=Alkalilimnicola ehrlichii TaxID=351052 RepID=A0A3E0WMR7_9GAMM|nr:hypothetical protein CAI21_16945 [Alkalilimnicola ehrlichii]RFA33441.1 hypothetical protein CAL65_17430 [Alkalilimnicola ehrlichii]